MKIRKPKWKQGEKLRRVKVGAEETTFGRQSCRSDCEIREQMGMLGEGR